MQQSDLIGETAQEAAASAVSKEHKPWSIRDVPPESRNAALAAADRADMRIGEWIARAILVAIKAERDEQRAPAVVAAPEAPEKAKREPKLVSIEEVGQAVAIAERVASLTGRPVPKTLLSAVSRQLRQNLAA